MTNNHSGEILFHLWRAASGGRKDVTSMAAMEIFWNRNYCDKFLNEMISYCGNSENTLARNLMILLSSIDIIDMSQLWSIMNISIDTPMRWLVACTHKMKEYVWVYISIGKVLDNLKYNLNIIVDQPELIHDKSS